MKITELTTTSYRNLPDATWSFAGPLTVVTGPAGAGTTGFLDAIALSAARLANIGGLPEMDRVCRPGEPYAKIRTSWALDEEECAFGGVTEAVLTADTAFQRGGLSGVEADPGLLGVMARYDHHPRTSKVVSFPAYRPASAGVALFSDFEQDQRNHRLDPGAEKFSGLPRAVAQLAHAAAGRSDDATFQTIAGLLEQLCPSVTLAGMSPGGQPEFYVRGSTPLPLARLSFSEKSAFVLAACVGLMGLARSVILLDTPELGLPPGVAGKWIDALRGATPEAQWVVASRDPEVIGRADRSACIVLQGGAA